jgi:hypothetical protein
VWQFQATRSISFPHACANGSGQARESFSSRKLRFKLPSKSSNWELALSLLLRWRWMILCEAMAQC